jgi:hypothetical protein
VIEIVQRVSQKDTFFFICSFLFVRPKRNEPKKKGAGNENFSLFWQNALGFTLPKKTEVRAISGLPPHLPLEIRGCLLRQPLYQD